MDSDLSGTTIWVVFSTDLLAFDNSIGIFSFLSGTTTFVLKRGIKYSWGAGSISFYIMEAKIYDDGSSNRFISIVGLADHF
jgi:hypothetical protein